MSEVVANTKPKGGRKGGTQFPQVALKEAIEYSKKLVSKTHTGPQPEKIVLAGVFGSSNWMGKVRASALKQYGLLDGDSKAYAASALAKKIASAPEEDLPALLEKACLRPKVFRSLFDTFKGDKISMARLKQQAANLEVHPENLPKCSEIFIESAVFAKLATEKNNEVFLTTSIGVITAEEPLQEENQDATGDSVEDAGSNTVKETIDEDPDPTPNPPQRKVGNATIQISITLDSSLDTEKLEKQLALLKKFGAI